MRALWHSRSTAGREFDGSWMGMEKAWMALKMLEAYGNVEAGLGIAKG